jgi:hypothetical protein
MSDAPLSDFSFTHPLRPPKNPFSEVGLDIEHAASLDPHLRHDDALAAQERERQHRSGGAPKRKRVSADVGGGAPPASSLTKPKLKKKTREYRGDSEAPNTSATWSNIERTDSKTRAASSPPVVYRNSGHSEVNGFICESIHKFLAPIS